MLCSSSGSCEWKGDRLQLTIQPGEHPFFLSREDAIRHAEWLRGMKEQFLARKKELKGVIKDYLGVGTWISGR
jgi:hypothetical protein